MIKNFFLLISSQIPFVSVKNKKRIFLKITKILKVKLNNTIHLPVKEMKKLFKIISTPNLDIIILVNP